MPPAGRAPAFDYVIVGAGTAGCAVAARLAEDPAVSVVLLEAGGPYRRILDVPLVGLWAWLRRPRGYCWEDRTTPQHGLNGRRVWWPAGRMVGGSSAINAMIYNRGDRASYAPWREAGGPAWSFEALLPYFRRAEDFEGGATALHGAGGPVGVAPARYLDDFQRAFLAGCAEAGLASTTDFNAETAEGAGPIQVTQRRGRRATAAGYLTGGAGRRVALERGARATRVVFERGRAVGVEFERRGARREVRASREVILAAGTVRSPQLLLLSGVGPADALRALDIAVVADVPGVGANLQDHLRVPVVFRYAGRRAATPVSLAVHAVRYLAARRGLFASNVCDAAAVVRTREDRAWPDARLIAQWRALPRARGAHVNIEAVLVAPRSRGHVALTSRDPEAPVAIDPAYVTEPEDRASLEAAVALARAIAATRACREAGVGAEVLPGGAPFDAHAAAHAESAYHAVGTCRLGAGAGAVVDPALRVRGVEGLRVVDASVIPSTVAGNALAPVLAVAERAADLIRA